MHGEIAAGAFFVESNEGLRQDVSDCRLSPGDWVEGPRRMGHGVSFASLARPIDEDLNQINFDIRGSGFRDFFPGRRPEN